MSMTATKTQHREVVTADELRVNDILIGGQGYDLKITSITEKPKTRVLHIEDTIGGLFEDDYRVRRTTRLYIQTRKCFVVQGIVDDYGPCIWDETYTDDVDEAREVAARWFARDDRPLHYVEIIEAEFPGKDHPDDTDYGDVVERIDSAS